MHLNGRYTFGIHKHNVRLKIFHLTNKLLLSEHYIELYDDSDSRRISDVNSTVFKCVFILSLVLDTDDYDASYHNVSTTGITDGLDELIFGDNRKDKFDMINM